MANHPRPQGCVAIIGAGTQGRRLAYMVRNQALDSDMDFGNENNMSFSHSGQAKEEMFAW